MDLSGREVELRELVTVGREEQLGGALVPHRVEAVGGHGGAESPQFLLRADLRGVGRCGGVLGEQRVQRRKAVPGCDLGPGEVLRGGEPLLHDLRHVPRFRG
ncbi:hypothetical protein [Actinomadura madurae]|uniref:hypothetical protein n=1 Tax=Actinomadura madurae TaxID=1993 RepID=UPI0020D24CB5|nr:hypothetical protein [Actinomadura madurae]MCP9964090.1 hypothetical protein [Actinomadura madurae]MCQ0012758.1 hypothetical protein [Actinomadura madurae]